MSTASGGFVFLPGLDGRSWARRPLAQGFPEQTFKVIGYPPDPALGYDELTGFVRERLPGKPAILIGESFSGPIAIRLAAELPDRVAGLVLLSTFARNPWPHATSLFTSMFSKAFTPMFAMDWMMLGPHGTSAQRDIVRQMLDELPDEVMRARTRAALDVDDRPALAQVRCPILVISGHSDWLIPQDRTLGDVRDAHPNAEQVSLDGAHDLVLTHQDEVAAALRTFAQRL